MRKLFSLFTPLLFLVFVSLLFVPPSRAQTPPAAGMRDLAPDTWVATDALGRTTPVAGQARPLRTHRFVGVFYFTWHSSTATPYDNSRALAVNPNNPSYGPVTAFHWWGEPAVGYFRSDDPWLARKNLQMLGDAGVDVLFVDTTNAFIYPDDVKTLLSAALQMRREGFQTPQIGFITHAAGAKTAASLYKTFYAPGTYRSLWFQWEGKPMLLGDRDGKDDDGAVVPADIKNFFTWRHSWAWDPGQDKWQWIDKYPQKYGWHSDPKVPEEVAVSVAGHPTDNLGRSYRSAETWGQGAEPPLDTFKLAADRAKGIQFSQQWSEALKIDPQFIFVTGWNEWIAQRFVSGAGGGPGFLGPTLSPGSTFFVDNYNEEFSRDAMPMKGGYTDNYYLQLVDGIRQYKGVRPAPVSHGFHAPATLAAWKSITPQYLDAAGDTQHRNWAGWGGLHYTDNSGRNDILSAQVACDARNIYFHVRTHDALSPYTGPHWMQLLLDADRNPRTGWNGYDFLLNGHVLSATQTTLKRLSDGKTWTLRYKAVGGDLLVTVPRVLLGLVNPAQIRFDFHWVDNAPAEGDPARIADWWYVGDSAPDGRFNYRYTNLR